MSELFDGEYGPADDADAVDLQPEGADPDIIDVINDTVQSISRREIEAHLRKTLEKCGYAYVCPN